MKASLATLVVALAFYAIHLHPASAHAQDNASVIRAVFGQYGSQAVAVARCESGPSINVYATNGQFWGAFQHGSYARARYGFAWNIWAEARAAYAYFRDSGYRWTPWSCGWAAYR